jgi:hypothetical protein
MPLVSSSTIGTRIIEIPAELSERLKILAELDTARIQWFVTERGDHMIKSWQVAAERFMVPEGVPLLQQPNMPDADPLNWVSAHLEELRAQYPGQWIAVVGAQVRAAAATLPALLALVNAQGLQKPFVTQVPVGEVIWDMAYARQEL